jgi:hypothetical protein
MNARSSIEGANPADPPFERLIIVNLKVHEDEQIRSPAVYYMQQPVNPDTNMCDKCVELDGKIEHYRWVTCHYPNRDRGSWPNYDLERPTYRAGQNSPVYGSPAGSQLRAGKHHLTLCSENVTVEVRNPLTPARRDIEVTYGCLNLRSNIVPIEVRVSVNNVRWRIVAKRFIQTNFLKFVEQRI